MTIYAYIRVSTDLQTTDNQKKVIIDAGFNVNVWVSEDGVSGTKPAFERPAFSAMMAEAQSGDTVIVTMIDRIGRSAIDILKTVEKFKELGIKLRILQFDSVDVTSSMGKMLLTVMAACAELERNLLVERTIAGIARTKEQGTKLGQPLKIVPSDLRKMVIAKESGISIKALSEEYNLPRITITRNIDKWASNLQGYEEEYYDRIAQYEKATSI